MRIHALLTILLALSVLACSGPGDGGQDDWVYRPPSDQSDSAVGGSPMPTASAAPMMKSKVGLAVGGAKDAGNFRENVEKGFLPLPTDLTYEGLFYDYTFDTGEGEPAPEGKLFSPSYVAAVAVNPISKKTEHYLSVGLNSGITDFARKKLNLVVVLDISGSMGSSFDEYYYDRFGNRQKVEDGDSSGKSKMKLACEAIVAMLDHLAPEDRLGIVLFDDESYLAKPMNQVGQTDLESIKEHLLDLEERGGTNMAAGMQKGMELMSPYVGADRSEYENRIIFLTDAMPNRGETSESGLLGLSKGGAAKGVYSTFIGIGIDFNTELIEAMTKIRGANYYSVHSSKQFKERLAEEFDFMVTPLVFDLRLTVEAEGYEIEKVYGSPEADEATGELMRVNTLFPSKVEDGETRGGVVLLKLRKTAGDARLKLRAEYADREGRKDSAEAEVTMPAGAGEHFGNTGVRKAVLLARYADLIINWTIEERLRHAGTPVDDPFVTIDAGIPVPDLGLSRWERTSVPLAASIHYQEIFSVFLEHLKAETAAVGDEKLSREAKILEKLATHGR